jgi:hypothetical protein
MLTNALMIVAAVVAVVGGIGIPLWLARKTPVSTTTLSGLRTILLCIAGIVSTFTALIALAAAAWGMDTRLPWGLGVYMYLIPALTLPAFLLLLVSVRTLSRALWILATLCPFAWYFGDRADRIASGFRPLAAQASLGMFFNAFTILLVMIAVIAQLAALCKRREQRQSETVGDSAKS